MPWFDCLTIADSWVHDHIFFYVMDRILEACAVKMFRSSLGPNQSDASLCMKKYDHTAKQTQLAFLHKYGAWSLYPNWGLLGLVLVCFVFLSYALYRIIAITIPFVEISCYTQNRGIQWTEECLLLLLLSLRLYSLGFSCCGIFLSFF